MTSPHPQAWLDFFLLLPSFLFLFSFTPIPTYNKIYPITNTAMSESFAILRQRRSDELAKLADEHIQHDLQPSDRDALKSAASSISFWTTVGSAVGVSLGLFAAIRLRSTRKAFFSAVRAQEKPTKVVFEDGRTGTKQWHLRIGILADWIRIHS
jgi:hypothetical protein